MNPDLAFLQEVSSIPQDIIGGYSAAIAPASGGASGLPLRVNNVILSRYEFVGETYLRSDLDWVNKERQHHWGNFLARDIIVSGNPISAVCFYKQARPIYRERLLGIDVSGVKLHHQATKIWCTEILTKTLRDSMQNRDHRWIVAGDFNSSETLDKPGRKPRGNAEFFERMKNLGLQDALRKMQGQIVPTFKNAGAVRDVIHQLDHLHLTNELLQLVTYCDVGSASRVFGDKLSDHLPIVADLESV